MTIKHYLACILVLLAWTGPALAVESGPNIYWLYDDEAKGPFLDDLDRFLRAHEDEPFTRKDSDSPAKISGGYRMNFGFQWASTDDLHWKNANTEITGNNFRYLWGEKRYNTFNPDIYDSFDLSIDIEPEAQWSAHMDLIVDPWAFVGETEKVNVRSGWGAEIDLDLPYWSNTGRTRDIVVRSNTGDTINIPAIQVRDSDTEPTNVTSGWGDRYFIPAMHVKREFRPIKNLWLDWNFAEDSRIRVFPYLDNAYAFTSDDPIGLSNNHIYWEASPWISFWTRGVEYSALGWEPGFWTADTAEGRQGERLRLLRGIHLTSETERTSLETMAASSVSPWNEYENMNNIAYAGRFKAYVTDLLTMGSTYTARTGMTDDDVESLEQACALDWSLDVSPEVRAETEVAYSYRGTDTDSVHRSSNWGEAFAARLHYGKEFESGRTGYKFAFTYMADDFEPPLATYGNTSNDQSWADHIEFTERSEEDKKIKIGDGISPNRSVFSIGNTTSLFDGKFEILSDYRQAHTANIGKFREAVFRNEATAVVSDFTTCKSLALVHKNPPNKDNELAFVFGGGVKCRLNDQIAAYGIYERANKYPYWPEASSDWFRMDPMPPYPFFNMYKLKFTFEPYKDLIFEYNHCRNGFKFATGVDDNINYDGIELRWKLYEGLSTQFTYKYSRVMEVNELLAVGTENFMGHHNIYSETNWEIWKGKYLRVQFGDLGRFITRYQIDPDSSTERSSIQHDVLDTQEIIRIALVGTF
ncbi:MAG: hypothetical protein ISS26_03925 [Candidatus Omnitrophica bacterium]|nr:hypothetical protein [Candidatus Omnitrophota bacterium]